MSSLNARTLSVTLVTALVAACATPTPTPPTGQLKAPMTPVAGFDAKLMKTAQQASGVRELRVYFQGDGAVRKTSVYHSDASRIPAAVMALVQERYPGATPRYYEHELYTDDGYVYEVDFKTANGEEIEVSVKEDGTLKYIESYIDADKVPEAIKATVASKVPGGTIGDVEVKEGPGLYEVSVEVATDGAGEHHLTFSRENALLRHAIRYPAFIEIPAP